MQLTWSLRPIVKWRLRRQENPGGEWALFDPSLDYRICRYNHAHHHGTHLHHPSDARAGPSLNVGTAGEAEVIMNRYRANYESLNLENLKREVKTWKSESNGN